MNCNGNFEKQKDSNCKCLPSNCFILGPTGPTGPTGATGATGPAGSNANSVTCFCVD